MHFRNYSILIASKSMSIFCLFHDIIIFIHSMSILLQGVKFEAEIKTSASHDSMQNQGGKEVIIQVTNEKIRKVREFLS